jgi:hypothetical protein
MLTSARSRLAAASRAVIEKLEERFFLTVTQVGDEVDIVGTPENDQIIISLDPTNSSNLMIVEQSSSGGGFGAGPEVTVFPLKGTLWAQGLVRFTVITGTGDHLVMVDETYGKVTLSGYIQAADGNDTLIAGSGNTVMFGDLGDDSIVGGNGGLNLVDGGDGNDIIIGGDGPGSRYYGNLGDDSIVGGSGSDMIDGGEGNDTIMAGTGNQYIWGGNGDDSLMAGAGDDTLDGGGGFDTLMGGSGNSLLMGGAGDDQIFSDRANDTMLGGWGNDMLVGGTNGYATNSFSAGGGSDTLYASAGFDIFQLDGESAAIVQDFDPTKDIYGQIRYMPAWWDTTSPTDPGLSDVIIQTPFAQKNWAGSKPVAKGSAVPVSTFTGTAKRQISGTVFNDRNGDGVRGSTETGISGCRVYLDVNGDGKYNIGEPSRISKLDGSYAFNNPPVGDYTVRALLRTGWTPTASTRSLSVAKSEIVPDTNLGANLQATISGYVFYDKDANRKADAGETAPSTLTAYIDKNNNRKLDAGEQSVITDAKGRFNFSVLPGTYRIRISGAGAGWYWTYPSAKGVATITVKAGQNVAGVAFGLTTYTTISGTIKGGISTSKFSGTDLSGWRVFLDVNKNGLFDDSEPSALTDKDGNYSLEGITPGKYKIRLVNPGGDTVRTGYTYLLPSGKTFRFRF